MADGPVPRLTTRERLARRKAVEAARIAEAQRQLQLEHARLRATERQEKAEMIRHLGTLAYAAGLDGVEEAVLAVAFARLAVELGMVRREEDAAAD